MSWFSRRAPRPPLQHTPEAQIERMRNLLAFLLVGAFISCLPVFTFKSIPEANEQLITYMVGQLSGMATMALGFYFVNKVGQDAAEKARVDLDAKRADSTGKLADAVVAAAGGNVASKPVEKRIEDMTLDELITAAANDASITLPDPMDEAVLRLALIAKRDAQP